MFESAQQVFETVRHGFTRRTVLVVGDLILDRYLWGKVGRISPEAPVPIVHLQRETQAAGGAANVARNLARLGLTVDVIGVTGTDAGRDGLLGSLAEEGVGTDGVIACIKRGTTVKTRVVGNHQQMLRIDDENPEPIGEEEQANILSLVASRLPEAGAMVLSDYAKGVLSDVLCRRLIDLARAHRLPVLVDPKGRDFSRYAGATLITPNRSELALATGVSVGDTNALLGAAATMREELRLDYLVLTLSEAGMALVEADRTEIVPAVAREVFDVSGAGDTVIAVFAAALAGGLNHRDSAHLANLAAGVVVAKVGTAPITQAELLTAIREEDAIEQASKICDQERLAQWLARWRAKGERVVFTNGCFDLLHVGHVSYLEKARRLGNRLVVGLNSDRSVRALKGEGRPVIPEGDRARVLAALASVDAVILFDEDTPLELIRQVRPDVLAKGADYREDEVVGAREVRSWGGAFGSSIWSTKSTTGIINTLRTNARRE